jgi:hypothetical protein
MARRDTPNLPTPDFTFDLDAPGACIAGVRPYRDSSYDGLFSREGVWAQPA